MRELGHTSIGGTAGNTDQPVPAADPQAPALNRCIAVTTAMAGDCSDRKNSNTSIERKIAALRDFNPAYDCSGSNSVVALMSAA
jgi:hypothetical protein